MAEYVKSRMTAAKVGVGLALFGLFAGVMEKVRSQESNHATLGLARPAAFDAFLKWSDLTHKITNKQIKLHSLSYKDFKAHQVLSYKELGAIKLLQGNDRTIKGELNNIKGEIAHKVKGQGIVVSASPDVPEGSDATNLLEVPGVVQVDAYNIKGQYTIKLNNLSSSPLDFAIESNAPNTPAPAAITPKGSSSEPIFVNGTTGEGGILTAQLFTAGQPPVTLTVSAIPDTGKPSSQFVAQALAAGQ